MRSIALIVVILLVSVPAFAQRPSDPALLVPQNAPELDYVAVANPFTFPAGTSLAGAAASVAFDSKGHLFVLTRGQPSLFEFDENGKFIRSFISRRWQGSATLTRSWFRDSDPRRDQWYIGSDGIVARRPIGFPLARDMGGEYTLAGSTSGGGFQQGGDQRQRAVLNGIWDIGRGVQLSGLYFYGSGERFRTVFGSDIRDEAGGSPVTLQRCRRDGTIIPRGGLVGLPLHRVDMRLQKQLTLSERVRVFGIFEVFNLFNHANYGAYTTNEGNANYGKPSFSDNPAYQARMLQLGFRTTF